MTTKRASIVYTIQWLDPDLEDEGFLGVVPAAPVRRGHDYDPGWDYEVALPPDSLALLTKEAVRATAGIARRLGLGPLHIFFADLSAESHVARYVNGTHSAPFIALDPRPFERVPPVYRPQEIRLSLLHEMGHAFLDSQGASTHDAAEEAAVEHFAQTGDHTALRRYARKHS